MRQALLRIKGCVSSFQKTGAPKTRRTRPVPAGARAAGIGLGNGLTLGFFDGPKSVLGVDVLNIGVLVKALSGSNDTAKVSFGTEGGLFQAAGVPTVVCGPGSIEQAHKPDEFLSIDQVVRCEAFLRRLIERVSAS